MLGVTFVVGSVVFVVVLGVRVGTTTDGITVGVVGVTVG